jgi:cytochrome P450
VSPGLPGAAGIGTPTSPTGPSASIDRNSRGHLGFAYGVHPCLGQNLARAEMQIAFATLARKLPGLRLTVAPDELEYHNNKEIYGVRELPVTW